MPKLLLITGDYPPICKGDANHAFFLARHLARRGVDVRVLTTALRGVPKSPGVRVFPAMRRWTWASLPRLAWYLWRSKPDAILQLFDQKGAMYGLHPMMTFAPTVAKQIVPTARFVTQFETPTGVKPTRLSRSERAIRKVMGRLSGQEHGYHSYGTLLQDSDHIIVLSEAHRTELTKEYSQLGRKSTLIPPPPIMAPCRDNYDVVRARGRGLLGIQKEEFLFAFFGYIYAGKGMETLLSAFCSLTRRFPQAKLVLIGGCGLGAPNAAWNTPNQIYWQEIQRLCRDLGLSGRTIWTGTIPPTDERASLYLRAADACVLPFDSGVHLNNSSFSVAVTYGLPVITTRADDTEGQFVDDHNVLLCPPRDSAALTGAMATVLTNPVLRERLRIGGKELAEEWFSWDRAIDRMLKTLF
jgi:glycosyltransferase involved in cell wall biosynthesis